MSTVIAPCRGLVRHWRHAQASSVGHGIPLRPGGRHGELTRLSASIRGLGRTAPAHPILFLMLIPRYGPSWPRVTSRRASLFLGVRVLTQSHMPGPRVVGGDMPVGRQACQSGQTEPAPEGSGEAERKPKGRARRSLPPEAGRVGASPLRSGETKPAPKGSGEMEPAPEGSGETEPAA